MNFSYEIRDILNIGIEITTEKNKHRLLEKMLNKAMEISGCDAGTLYVLKDGMPYADGILPAGRQQCYH